MRIFTGVFSPERRRQTTVGTRVNTRACYGRMLKLIGSVRNILAGLLDLGFGRDGRMGVGHYGDKK